MRRGLLGRSDQHHKCNKWIQAVYGIYGTAIQRQPRQLSHYATNNAAQVPYTPTVTAYEYISWQANDPLVHYLASDLNFQGTENGGKVPRPA